MKQYAVAGNRPQTLEISGAQAGLKTSHCKRVLMLLENAWYPQDERVRREAEALTRFGHKVSVICPAAPRQCRRETLAGVNVYRYPAPPDGDGFLGFAVEYGYAMAAMFARSLVIYMREGFDVVHAHNPPDTMSLIAALYKLLGKRFVYDHHDLAPEMYRARLSGAGSSLVYRMLVRLEEFSSRLSDHMIAVNESYKNVALERGRVPPGRITVVRNGPNLTRLNPVAPDSDLRSKADTILGYVGQLGRQDGLDYLLRALHHLVYTLGRKSVYLVLIGRGTMLPELQALAKELHIEDKVWFPGWISDEDLIRYLSTADICVDPDPSNDFNDRCTMVKMMEYMALGKPIVAFDLPEHRVSAQEAALYARPNDELDFARLLDALADDPERRARMGAYARRRVEGELAWHHQERHLFEAYETLASGGGRG
ncbi:MAG: glycosyltransferase family 4 protein [Anaerolineae bacterium]